MRLKVNTKSLHKCMEVFGCLSTEFMHFVIDSSKLRIDTESNGIICSYDVEVLDGEIKTDRDVYCEFRNIAPLLPLRAETTIELNDTSVSIIFNANSMSLPITFADVNIPTVAYSDSESLDQTVIDRFLGVLSKTSYFSRALQTERPVVCDYNRFRVEYPTVWFEGEGSIDSRSFTGKQLKILKKFEPLYVAYGDNSLRFNNSIGTLYVPAQTVRSQSQFSDVMRETELVCSVSAENLLNRTQKLLKTVGDVDVDVCITETDIGYSVSNIIQYTERLDGEVKSVFTVKLGYIETILKIFPKTGVIKIFVGDKVVAFVGYGNRVILSKGR